MVVSNSKINILSIMLLFMMALGISCQQAKEIPGELSEDIPNPVSDFTQKDRYKLGLRWYQQGQFNIAKKMWTPLAERGDCDAQYALGLLYFNGLGVRKNYNTALTWWGRAANQEQQQALYSMGIIYSHGNIPYTTLNCKRGCGQSKNLVESYKWFSLAKEHGSPREIEFADRSLNRIIPQMTDAEISEAQYILKEWKPEPSRCKSRGLYIINSRFLYN